MSRETVVWTTSKPLSFSADATSACVESARSRTSSRIAFCRSRRFIVCGRLAEYASKDGERLVRPRRRSTVSGGARRTTCSPAVSTSSPFSRAAVDDVGGAGSRSRRRSGGHAHARVRPRAAPRGRRRAPHRARATFASSSSSIASTTAQAAAHETGLPPNVEPWSPGANAPAASSATSSAPIGSPFARPFARVTRSGRTPSCSKAKNEPVRPTPVCTSSRQRSGGSSAAAATNSGVERHDTALAEDRLEQDQADVVVDRGDAARRRRSARRSARPGRAARTARACAG